MDRSCRSVAALSRNRFRIHGIQIGNSAFQPHRPLVTGRFPNGRQDGQCFLAIAQRTSPRRPTGCFAGGGPSEGAGTVSCRGKIKCGAEKRTGSAEIFLRQLQLGRFGLPGQREDPPAVAVKEQLKTVDAADKGLGVAGSVARSEEHTSELQSPCNLVCRLLLEKKKNIE